MELYNRSDVRFSPMDSYHLGGLNEPKNTFLALEKVTLQKKLPYIVTEHILESQHVST